MPSLNETPSTMVPFARPVNTTNKSFILPVVAQQLQDGRQRRPDKQTSNTHAGTCTYLQVGPQANFGVARTRGIHPARSTPALVVDMLGTAEGEPSLQQQRPSLWPRHKPKSIIPTTEHRSYDRGTTQKPRSLVVAEVHLLSGELLD